MARRSWSGPDSLRPLIERGHQQAVDLVDLFDEFDIVRVLSSRATRCYQTVAPLAAARRLPLEPSDALYEREIEAGVELARSLINEGNTSVLCTHGDVLPAIVEAFMADGLDLDSEDVPCAKGSTWVVDRHGGKLRGTYVPPPSPP